jgi:hypothetical protein
LQAFGRLGRSLDAGLQYDMRLHDLAALMIGRADHCAFDDLGVRQQRSLTSGPAMLLPAEMIISSLRAGKGKYPSSSCQKESPVKFQPSRT